MREKKKCHGREMVWKPANHQETSVRQPRRIFRSNHNPRVLNESLQTVGRQPLFLVRIVFLPGLRTRFLVRKKRLGRGGRGTGDIPWCCRGLCALGPRRAGSGRPELLRIPLWRQRWRGRSAGYWFLDVLERTIRIAQSVLWILVRLRKH
jgi:hypothetical protein